MTTSQDPTPLTNPETTLIEQVRFNVDFMLMMLYVSRHGEAAQAVQKIHVLLDQMEAES